MPIEVEHVELEHLEGAPLKVALAQIRFAPVHAIEKRERVADFQELLDDRYVAADAQHAQTVTIQLGLSPTVQQQAPVAPETVWPFHDHEREWSVALSSTSLALEARTYQDFDDFLAELRAVLAALEESFAPKMRTRLGLRYINEISDGYGAEGGVLSLLRPDLLSPIGTALGFDVVASLSELRFRQADGTFVLRHGLIAQDAYLLDFDYFNEEPGVFDADAIVTTLDKFHRVIEGLFVWALADSYMAVLKERSRAD